MKVERICDENYLNICYKVIGKITERLFTQNLRPNQALALQGSGVAPHFIIDVLA